MKRFGSLRELFRLLWRDSSSEFEIELKPNASTTYTANTTISLPNDDSTSQELVNTTGSQTLENKTHTSPVLNGNLTGDAILDEDDMVSNSATKVPTQQSVKQYIADQLDGQNEASEISYDGTSSGLAASNVQDAVDEVEARLDTAESDITTNTSDIGTLDTEKLERDGSIPMTGDLDMGGQAITNVGNVDGRDLSVDGTKLDGVESGATADQSAVEVPFTPTVTIGASDVQAAIEELDAEKQPLDGDLTALAALAATGQVVRTAADTYELRTLTGVANQTSVTNGDGVAGNPTLGVADNAVLPGTGSVTLPKGTIAERSGTPQSGMLRFNTENGQFEGYDGSDWGQVGGGGGDVSEIVNYITNPLFAADADDWIAYDLLGDIDALSVTEVNSRTNGTNPVYDATGITITRTTVDVIEGEGSGLLSKAAGGDYSDEGIAISFSMPRGQTATPTKVEFDYYSTSADFVGNLRVFIIKNTSGTPQLEELPALNVIPTTVHRKQKYSAAFLPLTDVNNYRLLIHNEDTSTNLATLRIDSVVVGSEEVQAYPTARFTNLIRDERKATDGNWFTTDTSTTAPATYTSLAPTNATNITLRAANNNYPSGTDFDSMSYLEAIYTGISDGQGVATQLLVPNNYIDRLITLEFDYVVTAPGTRADTDIQIFLVSDSDTVVQPDDPNLILSNSPDTTNYRSTVVLPEGGSWRMVLHCTTATSTTTEFRMGEVYLGVGAPGNIAQVPIATTGAPGISYLPKYIYGQGFTGLLGTTVYSQLGPDTLSISAGTYLVEYGGWLRFNGTSANTSVEGVIGFGEDGGSLIKSLSAGLSAYDGNDWRTTIHHIIEYTTASPITLALFARMINNGGVASSRIADDCYLKITRIS